MHRLCLLWMQLLMLWRAWRKARYLEGMNTALVLLFVNPRKPAMKTTFIWTGHVRLTYGRASWNCTRHHTTWSFDPFWKPVPAAKNRNKLYIYIHIYIKIPLTHESWSFATCNLEWRWRANFADFMQSSGNQHFCVQVTLWRPVMMYRVLCFLPVRNSCGKPRCRWRDRVCKQIQ